MKEAIEPEDMTKKHWYALVLLFCSVIFIDQFLKNYFLNHAVQDFFNIRFIVVSNHGAMLGLFSELPAVLRIVTLSTSGALVLTLYFVIQYFLPQKKFLLRLGLTTMISGIIGNVIDRIIHGYIVDYISVSFFHWNSPIFNFADLVQWVGYVLILVEFFLNKQKESDYLHVARTKIINPQFQRKFIVVIMSAGLFISFVCMIFGYTFIKVILSQVSEGDMFIVQKYTKYFLLSFLLLDIIFLLILFFVGLQMSYHIAGPLYAFEKFVRRIYFADKKDIALDTLKLRPNDEFKHLEALSEEIKAEILK